MCGSMSVLVPSGVLPAAAGAAVRLRCRSSITASCSTGTGLADVGREGGGDAPAGLSGLTPSA